ncbi:MAG TPA: ABC transporter permease [Acidimicrobiales bacterium]|nr:ABC transporter permease [Acidimicrobiales bacterium]
MAAPDLDRGPTMIDIEMTQRLPSDTPARDRAVGIALVIGAALLLVVAIFLISPDTLWRAATAIAALAMLWAGAQTLGRLRFGRNFSLGVWFSAIWVGLVIFAAIFADILPIEYFKKAVLQDRAARPALDWPQPLGRDANGTSLLSEVVYGARISLSIMALAILLGLVVGCLLGLIAGYFGGPLDAVINIFATATLAFPALILLFAIVAVFKASIWSIGIGLAVLSVPTYTRLMRAQTISLLQREFVLSARAMGASRRRVIFREIFPNAILPVASYSFISAAVVIVAEGSLAYLGLGVPPQTGPTWGSMIADGQQTLKTNPHYVFVPAVVMFCTVLSLNRLGDWARKKVLGENKL